MDSDSTYKFCIKFMLLNTGAVLVASVSIGYEWEDLKSIPGNVLDAHSRQAFCHKGTRG
jgi:hypothetical protein